MLKLMQMKRHSDFTATKTVTYDWDLPREIDEATWNEVLALHCDDGPKQILRGTISRGEEDRLVKITQQVSGQPTLESEFIYPMRYAGEWRGGRILSRVSASHRVGYVGRLSHGVNDGFSRWVKIVEKSDATVTSTKQFIWCGIRPCEERDVNNVVVQRFFEEGQEVNGGKRFYTRDHLGSVREMTGHAGNVRARYDYDPYGRRTKVTGDLEADFGFTGHYYHAPSGLHLAMYRAYDADIGRWINRDPIDEEGGLNLYGYVENDPANWSDLLGLSKVRPPINNCSRDGRFNGTDPRNTYNPAEPWRESIRTPSGGTITIMGGSAMGHWGQAVIMSYDEWVSWAERWNSNARSYIHYFPNGSYVIYVPRRIRIPPRPLIPLVESPSLPPPVYPIDTNAPRPVLMPREKCGC
jgi:RHS repeat-associated protein